MPFVLLLVAFLTIATLVIFGLSCMGKPALKGAFRLRDLFKK